MRAKITKYNVRDAYGRYSPKISRRGRVGRFTRPYYNVRDVYGRFASV